MGAIFRRNKPLFQFLIGLTIVFIIFLLLWKPLLPFLLGILIVYLLLPIVDWIDNRLPLSKLGAGGQRVVVVIITLIVLLVLLVLIGFLVFSQIGRSFSALVAEAPTIITNGLNTISNWLDSFIKSFSLQQQQEVGDAINTVGSLLGNWLQSAFTTGFSFIFSTFAFILGFFILPFFVIFFIIGVHDLKDRGRNLFSADIYYHISNFFNIMNNIFGRYIRAQILLGIITGFIVTIILMILGVPLAPALGLIAGAFQLIPTVGGAIAAVIGIIVTLAIAPAQIIWVIIMYVVINLVLGTVLITRFSASSVNMDTSIAMILIVLGGYLGGIMGMIIIVPLVAMFYGLYKYVMTEIKRTEMEEISPG